MRSKILLVFVICLVPLAAQKTDPPKHIFSLSEPLTPASGLAPRAVADAFLARTASEDGLVASDLAGVYVVKEYRTAHNGVTHFVYKQRFHGVDVFNAEWTVNIDRDGRVINAGGELFPAPPDGVLPPVTASAMEAVRGAVSAVNPELAAGFTPFFAGVEDDGQTVRFHRGEFGDEIRGEAVWYGFNGRVGPAWLFYVMDADGTNWGLIVDDSTGRVMDKIPMTFHQAPRGLVFERGSPQPNPNPGVQQTSAPPIVFRTLQSLAGDPVASPRGWVAGAETAGNNVIAGSNHLATALAAPVTAVAPNLDFSFPLQLGEGAPNPINFADAATVSLFYWINRAHDLFYQLGFDEAAGNYQQDNFGKGGAGGDPIRAFSQYGAAANIRANLNNAVFLRFGLNDGARAEIRMYLAALSPTRFFVDGSLDADVMIHEYTHGVSGRLVRQLAGFQGGSMGEAWSDFFAAEFLIPEGASPDGLYPVGEYFAQNFGLGIRTYPYTTNVEINPLTYAQLGRSNAEVHANGEIWVEALWEMRANLIRQFGEREGRRRVRLLVIDGMKLAPPAPTMVDMRDAILLADQTDFNGASQQQIWAAFAKRGLGVLAQSSANSVSHIAPSYEVPSPAGAMRFYDDTFVIGEQVRIVLQDSNLAQPTARIHLLTTSGDQEVVNLTRRGLVYTSTIATTFGPVTRGNGSLQLVSGDNVSAYYQDFDTGGGARLIELHVPTRNPYTIITQAPDFRGFAQETALFRPQDFPPDFPVFFATTFNLPFSFPFFGETHTRVTVFSTGLIGFGSVAFPLCGDVTDLRGMQGIAPMSVPDLRLTGRAQPNENVYRSQSSPDTFTIRWAAETPSPQAGVPPEPVNFAATLFADGGIQFDYGSGNKNLGNLGGGFCPSSLPTVGISNGHEIFTQVVGTHHNRPSLENAPTIIWEPPFNFPSAPEGRLESPAPGDRVQGVITVRGVTFDAAKSITRVDVFIDGVARAVAGVGLPRRDFCSQQQVRGCPNVGFQVHLNPAALGLAPGSHTVRLRATNARGAFSDFPDQPVPFQIDPGQSRLPNGRIEFPEDGMEVSGNVALRGYALADDLRVTAVDILVDGITYGRAVQNTERNDICAGSASPHCPRPGFTFNLITTSTSPPIANGRHRLAARALDEVGRYTIIAEITIVVNNTVNQLPVGVLESPSQGARVRGTIRIAGYAYDPDGTVRGLFLLVDGATARTIPYGSARPDICARLPEVAACPDIGFEVEFDTATLANGIHSIGVRAVDDRGAGVVFPRVIPAGINVVVEN